MRVFHQNRFCKNYIYNYAYLVYALTFLTTDQGRILAMEK